MSSGSGAGDDWFAEALRRSYREREGQEPKVEDETLDEEEIVRREAEYREWLEQIIRHDIRPLPE